IDGELRCDQYGVDSRPGDLRRQPLTVAHIARQICAVAVKVHDHDGGTPGIESRRNVKEHAVVAECLRLPEHPTAEIDMAAVGLFAGVQERPARTEHHAVISGWRSLAID